MVNSKEKIKEKIVLIIKKDGQVDCSWWSPDIQEITNVVGEIKEGGPRPVIGLDGIELPFSHYCG